MVYFLPDITNGTSIKQLYDTTGTLRRTRGSLDYSSDTEATSGSRSGYYYYRSQGAAAVPHSTIPTLGRQNALAATDISTKFNSLPRDRGTSRLAMNKRFGDRSVSLLQQDESDGALSAPEMPSIRRDRGGESLKGCIYGMGS
nr:unnamed protein product [Callosobruchus analis]